MDDTSIDLFREEDKRIKLFIKKVIVIHQLNVCSNKIKRKTKNNDELADLITNVVDVDADPNTFDSSFNHYGYHETLNLNPNVHTGFHPDLRLDLRIYTIDSAPKGFFVLRNALTTRAQHSWAKICIEIFSKAEHTNITNLRRINRQLLDADMACSSPAESSSSLQHQKVANACMESQIPRPKDSDLLELLDLRWASLGYHYNWTLRKYQEDVKSAFPLELSNLCRAIAKSAGCIYIEHFIIYTG